MFTFTVMRWFIRLGFVILFLSAVFIFLQLPRTDWFFDNRKSLNVYAWANMIDEEKLLEFEQMAGVKVRISYYENTEELLLKLSTTKGSDCDVILTSDYIVPELIKNNFVKKLDNKQRTLLKRISAEFLGHYYDQKNEYSIPYEWAIYGLGINKKLCKDNYPEASWKTIFKPPFGYGVNMLDEARTGVMLAGLYALKRNPYTEIKKIFSKINKLLQKQKPHVKVYSELLADYLVSSGNCHVVVAPSSLIWKVMRYDDNVDFVYPKEGGFFSIDSAMVSIDTKKDDMIFMFLDFLYQPNVMLHHFERYGIFPPDICIFKKSLKKWDRLKKVMPSSDEFKNALFFRKVVSEDAMNKIWVEVMS